MDLRIEKRIGVRAPTDKIWSLIGDLETWSAWNPVETGASGTIAFGGAISLTETISGLPERQVQGRVGDWQPYTRLVWSEKRGWQFTTTRYFRIEELEPGSCIVSCGVIFGGFRGEAFYDRHRHAVREAHEQMLEALKTAAEG